jgi:hypothetical protein
MKQETAMFNRCMTFKTHKKLCEVFTYFALYVERMSVLNAVERTVTCVHRNATQRDAGRNDSVSRLHTLRSFVKQINEEGSCIKWESC